jgi:Ca2+:H+ antiporter
MTWFLLFVPVAFGLEVLAPGRHLLVFAASSLAILPLAAWMGRATEELAARMGEGVGGLLNATFGNAAELIIALVALRAGLYDVVKASIAVSWRIHTKRTGDIIPRLLAALPRLLILLGSA